MSDCPHNVIRKKRYTQEDCHNVANVYVCGSCAKLFDVSENHDAENAEYRRTHPEPMFDRRPPWGLRNMQA